MRALSITLYGALAVTAAGVVLLRDPLSVTEAEMIKPVVLNVVAFEKSPAQFQTLEVSEPGVAPMVQVKAVSEVEAVQEPVQSIDERGDAMLFEAEALVGTPFDQAIVMPFE